MLRDIFEIQPHPQNPHVGDVPRIANAILVFGYRNALKTWNNYVIAGSHTLKALRELHKAGTPPSAGVLEIKDGHWFTPCIDCSDLSEEQAFAFMLADNQLPTLGSNDPEGVADLLDQLDDDLIEAAGFSDEDLNYFLSHLKSDEDEPDETQSDEDEGDEGEPDEDESDFADPEYTPNIIFPADNEWGIPVLDLNLQAVGFYAPVIKWGAQARSMQHNGTYHFYVEDYKFEALWRKPNKLVNSGCKAVVEVNFSTGNTMPKAEVLYAVIYRKRWLARYWQTHGVRVAVDLNIERSFFDIALLGVPKGWTVYCNRAYTSDTSHLHEAFQVAQAHAGDMPIQYTVYGGGKAIRELCAKEGWHYLAEDADVRRNRVSGEVVEAE